ncbi:helix-turn-helix domain-containing protein [Jeotgalibaca caeni]|uniref:helix-turn-helix domain-containing protein n=1 Tax=Jeotgalibaca caeni TaxID=3028623 RepID=UPI00237D37A4|nr:helix-turn-helix transcriptional regulator [Jeotgalibaca caeni]MDE1549832.1 helix-turn-helix transcriptional regulator [Jeotgalibaca caeni]
MNDLSLKKATYWNNRLQNCMEVNKYTQASLAEALNAKYGTNYGQKAVSGWLNIGVIRKNGEVSFPKFDTMVSIADFFNVDIGYLTGETNEDSFSLEKASSYLGLSTDAIKVIREITQPEDNRNYMWNDNRESLNLFLTAEGFSNFFNCLHDLHHTSILSKQEKRIFDNIDSAIDYIRNLEYQGKMERYELNEALVSIINEKFPNPPEASLKVKE